MDLGIPLCLLTLLYLLDEIRSWSPSRSGKDNRPGWIGILGILGIPLCLLTYFLGLLTGTKTVVGVQVDPVYHYAAGAGAGAGACAGAGGGVGVGAGVGAGAGAGAGGRPWRSLPSPARSTLEEVGGFC